MKETFQIIGIMILNALLIAGAIMVFSFMIGWMVQDTVDSSPTLKQAEHTTKKVFTKSLRELDNWASN